MNSNLTIESGLIKEITSQSFIVNPSGKEGFEVILIEKVGKDKTRFYASLKPGESLTISERLFGKFEAIVVDMRLRIQNFQDAILLPKINKHLFIDVQIAYRVIDAKKIALELVDPIRDLHEIIFSTLSRKLEDFEESEITSKVIAEIILDTERINTLGLKVIKVKVEISFPSKEVTLRKRKSKKVFICYSRKDQDFVLSFARRLTENGEPIWIDQWSIPPGANWNREIDNALYGCTHFIIILSPTAVMSEEVESELRVALDEKKLIIPILHQKCAIPRYLRIRQYIDYIEKQPDDNELLNVVLKALSQ